MPLPDPYNIQTNDGGAHRRRDRPNGGIYVTRAHFATTLSAAHNVETVVVQRMSSQSGAAARRDAFPPISGAE